MPALHTQFLFPKLDSDSLTHLLSVCSYPTLCRLRSTCKQADALVATEMQFRYTKALLPFFVDPDAFRSMLTSTDSVVSGSLAVWMASGLPFPPKDLDIYTTAQFVQAVLTFLEGQGYKLVGYLDPYNPEYRGGILRIIQLARGSQAIDVVVSLTQSATLPVVYFWSTPVMLYFGGKGLCIPYPLLLEQRRGLINPGRMFMDPDRLAGLVAKYEGRGFAIEEEEKDFPCAEGAVLACKGIRSATCPVNPRFFGDSCCLQTTMGTVRDRIAAVPFSGTLATLTNLWWRGGSGCGGDCNVYDDTEFDAWTQSSEYVGLPLGTSSAQSQR